MSKKEMEETTSQWQISDLYEDQESSQLYNQKSWMSKKEMEETTSQWQISDLCEDQESSQLYN